MYVLSTELHLKFILQYLSSEDVVKLSQVSTRLHSVLQDNLLWKYLFVRDWIWKQVCRSRNRCTWLKLLGSFYVFIHGICRKLLVSITATQKALAN